MSDAAEGLSGSIGEFYYILYCDACRAPLSEPHKRSSGKSPESRPLVACEKYFVAPIKEQATLSLRDLFYLILAATTSCDLDLGVQLFQIRVASTNFYARLNSIVLL